MLPIFIVRTSLLREKLKEYVLSDRGVVKAVVDCKKKIMAIGGVMHADEEHVLLEEESAQEDLWGINLHLEEKGEEWIEFDSMINIRPRQGNRSRGVEDRALQEQIRDIVSSLVQ